MNTSKEIQVRLARSFGEFMVKLIAAVCTFLKTLPIKLEGDGPEGRATKAHVEGLQLLLEAIQKSLDEPLPETVIQVGLNQQDNEQNQLVIFVAGDQAWIDGAMPHVGGLFTSIRQSYNITNHDQARREFKDAHLSANLGQDYKGEIVSVTRRDPPAAQVDLR